jgi:hypothetical protein
MFFAVVVAGREAGVELIGVRLARTTSIFD